MRIFAAASNTEEFEFTQPDFVRLSITPELHRTLMELRELVNLHELDSLNKAHVVHWVGVDQNTSGLWGDCLVVTSTGFHVSAYVKHQDGGHLECRVIYWTAFEKAYSAGQDLYVPNGDEEAFKAAVVGYEFAYNSDVVPA